MAAAIVQCPEEQNMSTNSRRSSRTGGSAVCSDFHYYCDSSDSDDLKESLQEVEDLDNHWNSDEKSIWRYTAKRRRNEEEEAKKGKRGGKRIRVLTEEKGGDCDPSEKKEVKRGRKKKIVPENSSVSPLPRPAQINGNAEVPGLITSTSSMGVFHSDKKESFQEVEDLPSHCNSDEKIILGWPAKKRKNEGEVEAKKGEWRRKRTRVATEEKVGICDPSEKKEVKRGRKKKIVPETSSVSPLPGPIQIDGNAEVPGLISSTSSMGVFHSDEKESFQEVEDLPSHCNSNEKIIWGWPEKKRKSEGEVDVKKGEQGRKIIRVAMEEKGGGRYPSKKEVTPKRGRKKKIVPVTSSVSPLPRPVQTDINVDVPSLTSPPTASTGDASTGEKISTKSLPFQGRRIEKDDMISVPDCSSCRTNQYCIGCSRRWRPSLVY